MKIKIGFLIVIQFFIFSQTLKSQIELRYENYIYDENIQTVIFHRDGTDFDPPVVKLNSDEQLRLKFDDLSAESKNLSYTFLHCDADWKPSNLLPIEYISGFAENPIRDYQFSFNTLISYNHYELLFPDDNARPILSGNYLLVVYADGNIDKPLITRRFYIVDPKTLIDAAVKQSSLVTELKSRQELTFTVQHNIYDNPSERISVYVSQNGRSDFVLENIHPDFVRNNELVFNNPRTLSFPGGNEFRYFTVKNHEYAVDKVASVKFEKPYYFFQLVPDKDESFQPYSYHPDLNGERKITADNVSNPDLEADYVYVDFSLNMDKPAEKGDFYVFGALSDFRLSDETRMKFDEKTNLWSLRLLLKQGYYNFEYDFAESLNSVPDNGLTQGCHYETENSYLIFVYYRNPGKSFDELIGVQEVNSMKKL
jgi:hypothetical protein